MDTLTYTTDPVEMTQIEAALTYVAGDTPAATHVAYLHHHPLTNTLFISAKSSIGTCWYLREIDGAALSSPPILRAASPTCRCIPRSEIASSRDRGLPA